MGGIIMAFNGSWYIKVGDYPIPLKFMAYKTYKSSRNVQDLDSYRDGDGVLHRNVLPHIVHKAEFETPILTNAQFRELMTNIRNNIDEDTHDCTFIMYDDFKNTYTEELEGYMPGTLEFEHFNKNIYEPMRLAVIEK